MNHHIYRKILIELGEVLQPISFQKKLGVEYLEPVDLMARKAFFKGYYVYQLRRSYGNSRQTEDDAYVSPSQVCSELQHALDARRKSCASYTGDLELSVIVTENDGRFYFILVKVGG